MKSFFILISFCLIPLIGMANPNLGAFPRGNYDQSCYSCSHFGNRLSCVCKDRNGFPRQTSLSVPPHCKKIENINGNLTCTKYNRHYHHRNHHHGKVEVNFDAGPIMNQAMANRRCPNVCRHHSGRWTGNWHTRFFKSTSVCQCLVWRY